MRWQKADLQSHGCRRRGGVQLSEKPDKAEPLPEGAWLSRAGQRAEPGPVPRLSHFRVGTTPPRARGESVQRPATRVPPRASAAAADTGGAGEAPPGFPGDGWSEEPSAGSPGCTDRAAGSPGSRRARTAPPEPEGRAGTALAGQKAGHQGTAQPCWEARESQERCWHPGGWSLGARHRPLEPRSVQVSLAWAARGTRRSARPAAPDFARARAQVWAGQSRGTSGVQGRWGRALSAHVCRGQGSAAERKALCGGHPKGRTAPHRAGETPAEGAPEAPLLLWSLLGAP